MHAHRILVPLFVIASLTVDLLLVGSLSSRNAWPNGFGAAVLGMAVGQVNLATVWGVLGYGGLPWRVAALLIVPIGWGTAIAEFAPQIKSDYHGAATWGVHFLTQTVSFAAILVLIRLYGAVLLLDDPASSDRRIRRRQFSVGYLFAWLTSTSLGLSALKSTFDRVKLQETNLAWSGTLILGLTGAMIGLTTLWLILDTRGRWKKLAAIFVTAVPVLCVMGAMPFFVFRAPVVGGVYLLWLVAGLYSVVGWTVLRMSGLRLVWLGERKPEQAANLFE